MILTLSPSITCELVIVTTPTLTVLLSPSIVTDPSPTVRIPVTRVLPLTKRVVPPAATLEVPIVVIPNIVAFLSIFKSFLPVIIPIESTLVTSSYVIVPAADIYL